MDEDADWAIIVAEYAWSDHKEKEEAWAKHAKMLPSELKETFDKQQTALYNELEEIASSIPIVWKDDMILDCDVEMFTKEVIKRGWKFEYIPIGP